MKSYFKLFPCVLAMFLLSSLSHAVPRTAFVHLFEWQWDDIAAECENFLGPKGFAGIQVSPPQKSIGGSQWWTRYQPVSYSIEGRSGSRAQFASMVSRCNAVGVDIYVDAVINHMAAHNRSFPEVPYGPNDFHNCTSDIDYSNRFSIQNCDLVGLNDLNTSSNYVQGQIANYMNDLIGMGVAGFRIDAAKHMDSNDINGIVSRLNGNPYIYQEVIGAGGEPVQPGEYTWIGDVTEFNFTNTMGHYFKLRAPLREISNIGTWGGWLNSSDAVVFVANHDNQRQNTNNTITHKDGNNANNMAHVFMLGWPYGYPKVMSSYDWNDHDQGPPGHGASSCNGGWLCEHRSRPIANMVAFRNNTNANFSVTDYWDNGGNQMAWGRGGLGFVAINMEGFGLNRTFQTGMPSGSYCDIIHADFDYDTGVCNGPSIDVDGSGNAAFNVNFRNASAIHVGARVGVPCPDCGGNATGGTGGGNSGGGNNGGGNNGGGNNGGGNNGGGSGNNVDILFTCYDGETYFGQSVYVVGNHPTIGDWNLGNAYKLNADNYPTWNGTISLPENYNVEWKCAKREDNNATAGVQWQEGDNNTFNTSNNTNPWAGFSGSSGGNQGGSNGGGSNGNVNVTFTCNNGHTYMGQSVYAVGNMSTLGDWDPANAYKLDPANYPTWSATISLPQNSNVEWKCLKREENNAGAGVQWQGGGNIIFNSGTSNTNTTGGF